MTSALTNILLPTFGFILTRHVNSELTNRYWNECVQCIRRIYPTETKIVIIDDNSNPQFLKADHNYENIQIIQSEFPQRGEILPFYYYAKNKFFENAVIIHDSTFINKYINFDKIKMHVLPLWHFKKDNENVVNIHRLTNSLRNSYNIINMLNSTNMLSLSKKDNWNGCFGCQCYINHDFLCKIQYKYNLFNMLHVIKCRTDRCTLERVMGIVFMLECSALLSVKSLFGNIRTYMSWNYTYQQYVHDKQTINYNKYPLIKVWTGR